MPLSTSMLRSSMLRQRLEHLRIGRFPRSAPRRFQSSNPGNGGETKPPTGDPIPVGSTPVPPVPLWQRLGPLTRAGEAYGRAQQKRPWATQIVSALVIYLAADISAQRISGKDYVPERSARNMVIGGVSAVPTFLWFVWLSRHFNYPSHILSLGVKIVVNQLVFTPTFNSYFFGAQALLSGDSLAETWDRIRRTVPISWLNAWKLWPAVTAFTFTFIPIEYRSVVSGVVAVGWQTYLSYLNRQAEIQEELAHGTAVASLPAVEATALQLNAQKRRITA
ncbi:hypothetical protein F5Y00DRAFT_96602 [Daldinia vernicosa]|uniref:uncharacterized protein n=1 Tax=Daldinia vernicosa TaxID=114800 RepID=UPI002007FBD8|nr:uncharacterized protein F5Y00DRAFT_96602 [Daldinia vernicosa]KAI0848005.1 hypothetical protein F5Y00DRAFT_96602 [Daldinia vernicosa]